MSIEHGQVRSLVLDDETVLLDPQQACFLCHGPCWSSRWRLLNARICSFCAVEYNSVNEKVADNPAEWLD